jgi:DNA-directed RNA polymerase specialized sigma24 family protein
VFVEEIPTAVARIVAREVWRCRRLSEVGLDVDDVRQELLIAACRAYEQHDGRASWGYVSRAVSNRAQKLFEAAYCASRWPTDKHGRLQYAQFLTPDVVSLPESAPETRLDARRAVAQILRRCSLAEQRALRAALAGDGTIDKAVAARVRRTILLSGMSLQEVGT